MALRDHLQVSFAAVCLALGAAAVGMSGISADAQEFQSQTGPRLDFPAGLATDGAFVYVANSRNNAIFKVGTVDHTIAAVAGQLFKSGNSDGRGAAALFASPDGVAVLGDALYVVDTENATIRKVALSSTTVSTIAGTANISGTENGRGAAAHFNLPTSVASDGKGTLYIADTGNSTIRKMTVADLNVSTIGGQAQTEGKEDGPASKSSFNRPRGIATDGKFLYVADTANQLIRKIDLGSNLTTTIAGKAGVEGSDNGAGTAATFSNPEALATDGTTLYIADADNHAIRKLNLADNMVSTLVQVSGHIGSGLALSRDGRTLYLSDTTENAVAQIDVSNGNLTTLFPNKK